MNNKDKEIAGLTDQLRRKEQSYNAVYAQNERNKRLLVEMDAINQELGKVVIEQAKKLTRVESCLNRMITRSLS